MKMRYHKNGIGVVERGSYAVALVDDDDGERMVCEVYGVTSQECARRADMLCETMNYRALLLKYIDHVGNCEGACYIDPPVIVNGRPVDHRRASPNLFTDEEWEELNCLREEGV